MESKECKVDGCEAQVYVRGFCSSHYSKLPEFKDSRRAAVERWIQKPENKEKDRACTTKRKESRRGNPKYYAIGLLSRTKTRAKKLGLEFDLRVDDIHIPNKCPVLDIPLNLSARKADFDSASIDRIDSDKGYVKGNVAVISWRANRIKGDSSLENLVKVIKWLKEINEKI